MKPDYLLCDVCGAKVSQGHSLFVPLDRVMDAAGSNETVGESYDLCGNCILGVIGKLLSPNGRCGADNHELGRRIVAVVTGMKSRAKAKRE